MYKLFSGILILLSTVIMPQSYNQELPVEVPPTEREVHNHPPLPVVDGDQVQVEGPVGGTETVIGDSEIILLPPPDPPIKPDDGPILPPPPDPPIKPDDGPILPPPPDPPIKPDDGPILPPPPDPPIKPDDGPTDPVVPIEPAVSIDPIDPLVPVSFSVSN